MTSIGLTPGAFDPANAVPDLAFPVEEYQSRVEKLRVEAQKAKVDLLWITTPDAVCWMHGFLASWYKANAPMRYPQCYGTALHVESGRYIHFDNPSEKAISAVTSVCTDNRWLPDRDATPNITFIMDALAAEGWLDCTVGMEFWSYVPNRAISTMFEGAFLSRGCKVVDTSVPVRRARRVKSVLEIECIERATAICDIGHRAIIEHLVPDMTELELFGEVTRAMMAAGGEFPALIPIFNSTPVVDGTMQITGHSMARRKPIVKGTMLKTDLCGVYNRYHGNVLRGYYVGDDPPAKLIEQYRCAGGVFDVIQTEIKAGMTVGDVNKRLRQYYEDVGIWSETEGWALGYELGLSLPPDWVGDFYFHLGDNRWLDRVFEENMVTNFESCFSTAMIDTLVYGKDGTRVLSEIPLELIVVPV